jgi:hypothetical protein
LEYGTYENEEMIELISKHGFNINERDNKGLTPIEHAAQLDSE